MKKCTRCNLTKPLTEFGKSKQTRDKLTCWCLQCKRDYSNIRRKTPEGIYDGMSGRQRFYGKHRPSCSKPFSISKQDFVEWYNSQSKVCDYCGLSEKDMSKIKDSNIEKVGRLTIDCKDNAIGYSVDNIILSCLRCNFTKGDFFSYEAFKELARKYITPEWEKQLGKKLL